MSQFLTKVQDIKKWSYACLASSPQDINLYSKIR